jgi:hypothetical protein
MAFIGNDQWIDGSQGDAILPPVAKTMPDREPIPYFTRNELLEMIWSDGRNPGRRAFWGSATKIEPRGRAALG